MAFHLSYCAWLQRGSTPLCHTEHGSDLDPIQSVSRSLIFCVS